MLICHGVSLCIRVTDQMRGSFKRTGKGLIIRTDKRRISARKRSPRWNRLCGWMKKYNVNSTTLLVDELQINSQACGDDESERRKWLINCFCLNNPKP